MYILKKEVKNKFDGIDNLEFRNLNNNTLTKKYLKKGQLKHNPSSVKEWYNSVYNLGKNNYVKTLPLKDVLIYRMFDTYFNSNKLKKDNDLSMSKIFVGKPEVKHFSNKINITLYIFNKWIVHFYRITGMIRTAKLFFNLNNKQFAVLENKPFIMSILLLKHPKFDQKLIKFINEFLIKMFDNNNNGNNKFIGILCTNIINFFNRVDLYDLLGLKKDVNIYKNKLLINERKLDEKIEIVNRDLFKTSKLNKNIKKGLYIYLCIINYFFNYIGFPKIINILRKVLLCSSKEKRLNNLKIMFEKLKKTYLKRLKIDSLFLLVGLINLFLMTKKVLKSIYIMKWYKRNIYYSKYKFNIKNILSLKNILNKLYNNKIEINIINLKYLYLDGNILALTVVRKLKNRKRRVLRVIRMALRLSKKPFINKFYSDLLNANNLETVLIKKDLNLSINNNIPLNKDLISKPISYKSRIIFFYLKHKIISGMKLQGTGRLTKRLTASRSISKSIGKGSLKNKASSYNGLSTVVLRGYVKSNLQYVNINSYNRIGAYGIKSWVSSH
jgi:hypothetical protein